MTRIDPPTLEGAALYQDCLRLQPLTALIPDANDPPGLCPDCGGTTCDCAGCLDSVAALAAGDWEASLQQPYARQRAISWTPDGGLAMREETP